MDSSGLPTIHRTVRVPTLRDFAKRGISRRVQKLLPERRPGDYHTTAEFLYSRRLVILKVPKNRELFSAAVHSYPRSR